ncbi:chaperonin 10-like protein [Baffinella frigidus]|nr:chaperonin 10-like protein [Cryptophyta sp. CCMP2293]
MPAMKSVQITGYGKPNDVLQMTDTRERPVLTKGQGQMLLKVHAVSLTPGDQRRMSGDVSGAPIKLPPFPYVPCGDVCGTVLEVDENEKDLAFKVDPQGRDCVVGTWDEAGVGGLAEYMLVNTKMCAPKPANADHLQSAALANSAQWARCAIDIAKVTPGDRVLVLGGSGGVGSMVIQMARNAGASYVAATSSDVAFLTNLGVDKAINYQETNWWEDEEFKLQPFDVIFDHAEGYASYERAYAQKVIKSKSVGGRWIASVWKEWRIKATSLWEMLGFMLPGMWHHFQFRFFSPAYHILIFGAARSERMKRAGGEEARSERMKHHLQFGFSSPAEHMLISGAGPGGKTNREIFKQFDEGKFKVIIDKKGPFPFTEAGVKGAYNLLDSRRAKGKIVIEAARLQGYLALTACEPAEDEW